MENYSPRMTPKTSQGMSQIDILRQWRDDALIQHQYRTAEHIGDKIYSITNEANDLYWLAQVHYGCENYARGQELLISSGQVEKSISCKYLAALCLTKMSKWDEALELIGQRTSLIDATPTKHKTSNVNGINLIASICFLRGQIYTNLSDFERAKECYIEAVQTDVKCYEAFDQLIKNNLISATEEWKLLNTLDFSTDCGEVADLIRSLYAIRLSKYINISEYHENENILIEDYGLGSNSDVLLARADLLFTQCRFKECLQVCEEILKNDKHNMAVMPNYLSCLHELDGKNKIFIIGHQMAAEHPEEPMSWLAVGIYYLTINKAGEARRYFSKASIMNPYFSQAWIGFAHTFAIEGEHEQAISAYSTAARLFQGTHLPPLFLGMQHLQLHNFTLAEEYLNASFSLCKSDPLLLNEMGVVAYHKNDLETAEKFLLQALNAASQLDSEPNAWLSIRTNLGHVYRRLEQFDRSMKYFEQVIRISPKEAGIHSAMGLVQLQAGNIDKAIVCFHDALSIAANDTVATDLLKRSLEENVQRGLFLVDISDDEIDLDDPVFEGIVQSTPPPVKTTQIYDDEDSFMDVE